MVWVDVCVCYVCTCVHFQNVDYVCVTEDGGGELVEWCVWEDG